MSRHSSNRQTPSRTRRGPAGRHAPHLGALACAIAAAFGAAGPAMLAATATPAAAAADLRHATVRPAAVPPGWQQVAYAGVTLRVPASWPVVDLAANPMTCPLLDVHTVYLGQPGPDPACPAAGLAGKTEAVQIMPLNPVSPDALAATQPVVLGGTQARTNPDPGTTHTIIDVFPAADREVTLSYGTDHAVIAQVQSSIQVGANVQAQAGPAPAAAAPAATAQGVYQGGGFDACAAPASGTMNAWLASPYRAIGVYIGGINRACAQANLTGSWITTIQGQGWHYFPLYPGLQASCGPAGNATIDPANAASEGTSAAADAVTQAQNLGIPASTPIVYDMEAYSGCASEVITYLSAWDSELHALGYAAGVYESFSDVSDLINANGSMTEPDIIDYAAWDGVATTNSSYLTSSMWTSHQRIHQYAGGHSETWGGQTINIDNN